MGTDRTKSWLQTRLADRDPQDWAADLVESIPEMADYEAKHRAFWVSKTGNNSDDGSFLQPFSSVGTGLAAASSGTQTVYVFPGTYTENITWPTTDAVRLIGLGRDEAVTLSATTSGTLLKIAPGATPTSAFDAYLENLHLVHGSSGTAVSGLVLSNASMNANLIVRLKNVSTSQGAGTSVLIKHSTAGSAIRLYWDGNQDEIAGPIYAELRNSTDQLRFSGMRLTSGIKTGTHSISGGVAEVTLKYCEVLDGGITGGTAAQKVNAIQSWVVSGGSTYGALEAADIADQTHNVV